MTQSAVRGLPSLASVGLSSHIWATPICGDSSQPGGFGSASIGPDAAVGAGVDVCASGDEGAGIVINPAAFSFTSIAILDALKMFPGPIIELHISNIHRREPYYHRSYVS